MKTESRTQRNGTSHPVRQTSEHSPQNQPDKVGSRVPALHIQEILVPTDFSEHSNYALRYAMSVARQFGARLTLLHVIEPASFPSDGLYVGPDFDRIAVTAEHNIASLWEREKSRQLVAWRSLVKEGIPDQVILQTANNQKTDLIIIATHGRTGLARVFLGSTAERVIRQAPCPVLVVRMQPNEKDQQPGKN